MNSDPHHRAPLVFIIAGESSGDALGAALMAGLKTRTSGAVRFIGVGGPLMETEGLSSLFPMSDLAVMGLAEVLPKIPALKRRISETAAAAITAQPDVVVSIDSPDFSFRVAKRLKKAGLGPLVHYVAPTVWAWRPKRAKKIAKFLDHLLCLFPFEPPYFEAEGLAATFVGHPVFASDIDKGDGEAFRARHGIPGDADILLLLPGSRSGEVVRHTPIFLEVFQRLKADNPGLRAILPTVPHVASRVSEAISAANVPVLVTTTDDDKRDAFKAAAAALAASGTVSLELASAGVPSVIAYTMNPITAFMAKRLVRVRYASLVNIVEDTEIFPEFLQEACTPEALTGAIQALLTDQQARDKQAKGVVRALTALGQGGEAGGLRAADAVLSVIQG